MTAARSERYDTQVRRQYDSGGRLVQEEQWVLGERDANGYEYDRDNRQVPLRYPDGSPVERTFTVPDQKQPQLEPTEPMASY